MLPLINLYFRGSAVDTVASDLSIVLVCNPKLYFTQKYGDQVKENDITTAEWGIKTYRTVRPQIYYGNYTSDYVIYYMILDNIMAPAKNLF
jgi:hypothetical protein